MILYFSVCNWIWFCRALCVVVFQSIFIIILFCFGVVFKNFPTKTFSEIHFNFFYSLKFFFFLLYLQSLCLAFKTTACRVHIVKDKRSKMHLVCINQEILIETHLKSKNKDALIDAMTALMVSQSVNMVNKWNDAHCRLTSIHNMGFFPTRLWTKCVASNRKYRLFVGTFPLFHFLENEFVLRC